MLEEANRIEQQKALVESIGRYLEKQGYQPVAGRILGLLMVMDKEEYTFDEIVEEMQISKSTASNALKNLELREAIEYITYPGNRKRYFQVSFKDVNMVINETERKFTAYANLLDQIICLKHNQDSKNAVLLKNLLKGISFFLSDLENFKKIKY